MQLSIQQCFTACWEHAKRLASNPSHGSPMYCAAYPHILSIASRNCSLSIIRRNPSIRVDKELDNMELLGRLPCKIILIPADSSQARMIEHLKANDGQGIICETEADTLSGAKSRIGAITPPSSGQPFFPKQFPLPVKRITNTMKSMNPVWQWTCQAYRQRLPVCFPPLRMACSTVSCSMPAKNAWSGRPLHPKAMAECTTITL